MRILCVPVFIGFYLTGHFYIATGIFIAASFTDMLDGQIARAKGIVTNFGKIMDPLADKILVISAFVLLVQEKRVAGWMLIVILAREFVVSGLRTVAASEGIVIAAGISGKIKTVLYDDIDRLAIEITECKHMGLEVLAPDVNQSYVEFGVVPAAKQVRFGMAAVKGVGVQRDRKSVV